MRYVCLGLALVCFVGCQDAEAEYAKALAVYESEVETLAEMEAERQEIVEQRDVLLGQVDALSQDGIAELELLGAQRDAAAISGKVAEARQKAVDDFQKPVDALDKKIAKQQERVTQAQKTLQEAENRR